MPADALKQRLIGAVALLLLGAVAWFTLLSADNPVDPMARTTQIPQEPDIKAFSVPEPVAPKDIEPIGSERDSRPVAQPDAALPAAPRPEPAAVAPRPATPAKPEPARAAQNKPAAAPASKQAEPKPVAAAPKPAEAKPASKPAESATAAKPAQAAAKPAETFQLDQHGLPVAWVVQVGSFSTQANADKIKQTLQDKGFKAYTQSVKTDKGSAIKVYVGPKLSRERADAQKKAIDQALQAQKITSMVVRFPIS